METAALFLFPNELFSLRSANRAASPLLLVRLRPFHHDSSGFVAHVYFLRFFVEGGSPPIFLLSEKSVPDPNSFFFLPLTYKTSLFANRVFPSRTHYMQEPFSWIF